MKLSALMLRSTSSNSWLSTRVSTYPGHSPPLSPVYRTSFVQPTLSGFLTGSDSIGPRCRHRYVSRLQNAHSAARNEAVETVAPSNLNSITLPSSSCIGQVGSAS